MNDRYLPSSQVWEDCEASNAVPPVNVSMHRATVMDDGWPTVKVHPRTACGCNAAFPHDAEYAQAMDDVSPYAWVADLLIAAGLVAALALVAMGVL